MTVIVCSVENAARDGVLHYDEICNGKYADTAGICTFDRKPCDQLKKRERDN